MKRKEYVGSQYTTTVRNVTAVVNDFQVVKIFHKRSILDPSSNIQIVQCYLAIDLNISFSFLSADAYETSTPMEETTTYLNKSSTHLDEASTLSDMTSESLSEGNELKSSGEFQHYSGYSIIANIFIFCVMFLSDQTLA